MDQPSQSLAELTQEVAALRRQDQRLRLILDGVRDHAVSMLAPDGTVETFNAPAERIKGYALAEVQGRHYGMFFTPDDQAAGLPARELDVARATGRYEGEGWRQRKDGSRFYAMVSLSALRGDAGELVGFVKVTQDITERRTLAEEARRAREEAERERARLRQMFDGAPAMITLLSDPVLLVGLRAPPRPGGRGRRGARLLARRDRSRAGPPRRPGGQREARGGAPGHHRRGHDAGPLGPLPLRQRGGGPDHRRGVGRGAHGDIRRRARGAVLALRRRRAPHGARPAAVPSGPGG